MNSLSKLRSFLWFFGKVQIPLIGYARPKLIAFDEEKLVLRIRLNRRTRNHLKSLYFGAFAIGADLAGGLHAFFLSDQKKVKTSIAFKSFQAQFLKRAESDVYFVCDQGKLVNQMIDQSIASKERINKLIDIKAYTDYPDAPECVAEFKLELSLKVLS